VPARFTKGTTGKKAVKVKMVAASCIAPKGKGDVPTKSGEASTRNVIVAAPSKDAKKEINAVETSEMVITARTDIAKLPSKKTQSHKGFGLTTSAYSPPPFMFLGRNCPWKIMRRVKAAVDVDQPSVIKRGLKTFRKRIFKKSSHIICNLA
jgi:hypothetical protein